METVLKYVKLVEAIISPTISKVQWIILSLTIYMSELQKYSTEFWFTFFTIFSYVGCFNRWLNNNDNQVDLQIGTNIDSCWNVDIIIN